MMYCAWSEGSKMIGESPPNVVAVVRTMGRKRRRPAWWIAS
jgi:hypothetical protein